MAAKTGRLEARLTLVNTHGATFTDSVGATVVQVPAGNWYLTDLLAEINSDLPRNWAVTISKGEGSVNEATGLCTITTSDGPWSVTWNSTDLRDLLGFTGDIAGASSPQTGTQHCRGLWLPGCPAKYTRHGDGDAGTMITDMRHTVGPSGTVKTLYSERRQVIDGLRWAGPPGQRTRSHMETYANESMESFIEDCQLGDFTFGRVGAPVRIIWDAAVDATYSTGKFMWPPAFDPETMFQGFVGRYQIAMPRFCVNG